MLSHSEVFISILQDRALVHNLASLQELALVTGIMCNAGLTETSILSSEAVMADQLRLKGLLARVQRLMFDLMPRYCSTRGWDKVCEKCLIYYLLLRLQVKGVKCNKQCTWIFKFGFSLAVERPCIIFPQIVHVWFTKTLEGSVAQCWICMRMSRVKIALWALSGFGLGDPLVKSTILC